MRACTGCGTESDFDVVICPTCQRTLPFVMPTPQLSLRTPGLRGWLRRTRRRYSG